VTSPHLQRRLFCFGLGYSASRLARSLIADGWAVAGTCRTAKAAATLRADGIDAHLFDGVGRLDHMESLLAGATHLLSSVPPDPHNDNDGDPVLRLHRADIARCAGLKWIGYLSTTGAYGDTGGAWVDEAAPVAPTGDRGKRRVQAERQWLGLLGDRVGNGAAAVHVFRLAGIYGPGRSALDAARRGVSHRIIKPGHVFSRIHVDDIVSVLRASMDRPNPGAIYNVCDNVPAPSAEITSFACKLLGIAPPPEILFEDADLSPMAKSFYADNRRVRNNRIRDELGVKLTYPDYETGLRAIFAGEAN
jgi:nucleoside-diphosphate-sugar epimerase